jgi:photosystem II stability/assembly factor-like uncharacterized protein
MKNRSLRWLAVSFFCLAFSAGATAQSWEVLTSGIDTNLRGVSAAVDAHGDPVVWAAGSFGAVILSNDQGRQWKRLTVAGGEDLDFRGVAAFSDSTAYVMSSGEGTKSRIYKTTDGGTTWKLQYSGERKEFFLDAIRCLSAVECYALGDPMDGRFVLLRTEDGEHWEKLTADGLQALPQEGAFAASNSCLSVERDTGIYFVTGGPAARTFHSSDKGKTWTVTNLPIAQGNPSSGAFSVAVDGKTIVVVGGDYRDPKRSGENAAAYSEDGGMTWNRSAGPPAGFRSAVGSIDGRRFVTVGTSGSEFSGDNGAHWITAGPVSLNAVSVLDVLSVWGAGANGTVAKFDHPTRYEISIGKNAESRDGGSHGETASVAW